MPSPALHQPHNTLVVVRGETKTLLLTVTQDDVAVDLTGARVVLTVKEEVGKKLPVLVKDSAAGSSQVDFPSPRAGQARIFLDPADTRNLTNRAYVYDCWVILASGDQYPVIPTTVLQVLTPVSRL